MLSTAELHDTSEPVQMSKFKQRFQAFRKTKRPTKPAPEFFYGRDVSSIPQKSLKQWLPNVVSAYTGPNSGLTQVDTDSSTVPVPTEQAVAGCTNWNCPTEHTYGISLSLYEEDTTKAKTELVNGIPVTKRYIVGEPNADVFGIQTRENNSIMAIADGVNWGKKSRLAARCAVFAVMEHLNRSFKLLTTSPTAHGVSQLLLDAVTSKAQELIMDKRATLTTLSVAVVCQTDKPEEWGLFVCSVGDSPVYVYCPHTRKVIEVTVGCHEHNGTRDMRMAGGVLGPSLGSKPDLGNLTISYLPVYNGDIVFATSDGVSDNFSSKVMKGWEKESGETEPLNEVPLSNCCEHVSYMTRCLNSHQEKLGANLSAQTVTACLINHSVEVTEKKRTLRSYCIEQNIDIRREALKDPAFSEKLSAATGKLDHATVVAYEVGVHKV